MQKSTILNTLNKLPNKFNIDEFLEHLIVIQKIDEGLKKAKAGKTLSHEKVKKSLKDLKSINDYISLDSTFYAARFISNIIKRVDQLIEFPESGRMVPEKNTPEIRELIEGNYRIFYRLRKENIIILRIHNAARRIK